MIKPLRFMSYMLLGVLASSVIAACSPSNNQVNKQFFADGAAFDKILSKGGKR